MPLSSRLSSPWNKLVRATAPSSRRTIWHSSTFLSSSPSALLEHLQQQQATASPTPPSASVYALSKNIPAELLDSIHLALSTSTSHCPSIGVLSDVLPSHLALPNEQETFSIAFASYHPTSSTTKVVPFRSTLLGRPHISVGREVKQVDPSEEHHDVGFEAFLSGKKWGFGEGVNLSEGRRAVIDELKGVRPEDVKQITFFAADRIQPFLGALSTFASSANIGLVGSSTPFHSTSHAPYSLFYNGELASTGAVGLAIVDSQAPPSQPIAIDYAGLEAFGEPMEVTSSKGNIVLTLASQNAARLLLNAVQALPKAAGGNTAQERSEEKEKEFYAAVFESAPTTPLDLSKARQISKIMAGDPSRGAMSVETEDDVKEGYSLVFLHRPSIVSTSSASPPSSSALSFVSHPSSDTPPRYLSETPATGEVVERDEFVAVSENGVVVSRMGRESWVCAIEGVELRLEGRN